MIGFLSEIFIAIVLAYVPFLNVGFGTRQIAFAHWAAPMLPWMTTLVLYDEARKIYVRKGTIRSEGKVKLDGWVVRNTFY